MNFKMIYIVIFLALGIIVSLFISYKLLRNLYSKELMLRLDPIFESNTIVLRSIDFLLLGDSRIAQWSIPDSIIPSSNVLNYGVYSQTSFQVLTRTSDYFGNYKAQFAIIQVGINDLKVIGIYPEKKSHIINQTIKNIKSILELCIQNDCTPIFITILPTGPLELKRIPFCNNEIEAAIITANIELIKYCKNRKIEYLDFDGLVLNESKTYKKSYYKNYLHLNELGYDRINSLLYNILSKTYSK